MSRSIKSLSLFFVVVEKKWPRGEKAVMTALSFQLQLYLPDPHGNHPIAGKCLTAVQPGVHKGKHFFSKDH